MDTVHASHGRRIVLHDGEETSARRVALPVDTENDIIRRENRRCWTGPGGSSRDPGSRVQTLTRELLPGIH